MKKLIQAVAAALLLAGPAQADVFTHNEAGLQFELPNGWTTKQNGDTLEAEGPNGLPTVQFDVIAESDIADYVDGWAEGAGETFEDIQVTTDAKVETVNGLKQIFSEGTAMVDGTKIDWDLTIVQGGKKPMAIMAFGANLEDGVIKKIYNSIKKAQ